MITLPIITSTIEDYNSTGTIYDTACVSNAAPCERLRICVSLDKAQYNANVYTNGGTGDFNTNFVSAAANLFSNLPVIGSNPSFNSVNILTNTATQLTVCQEIRIPDTWAGGTGFVVFDFVFNVGGEIQHIWYPVTIGVSDYNQETAIVLDNVVDSSGNEVNEDFVCVDAAQSLKLNFSATETLDWIAAPHVGTGVEEYDPYSAGLTSQSSSLITTMTPQLSGSGCIGLDVSGFNEGECCLKVITKRPAEVVQQLQCDCFQVTVSHRAGSCGNGQTQLFWAIFYPSSVYTNIASATLTASNTGIGANCPNLSETLTIEDLGFGVVTSSGSWFYCDTQGDVTYNLEIITNDGCCYGAMVSLPIVCPVDGLAYDETVTICPKEPANPRCTLGIDIEKEDISCAGDLGSATVVINSGVAPYTYLWNTGATTQSITGLAGGTYEVTVTDADNCSVTASVIILESAPLLVDCTIIHESAPNTNNGSIALTATGGTGNYTYDWTGPNGFVGSVQELSNLAPGTYTITITDSNNCSTTIDCAVNSGGCPYIDVQLIARDLTCNNVPDGLITGQVTGGVGPYTYAWSNGQTTPYAENLAAGMYSVVVTDADGCQGSAMVQVNQPDPFVLTCDITTTNEGQCEGSILLTVTGGTGPYTYFWSNGAQSQHIHNLCAGTYTVTVTDANGCQHTETCELLDIPCPVINVNMNVQNTNCNGSSNGLITASPLGGVAPYTYLWNTGDTTATIGGLPAGNYSVTVTDGNGCTGTNSAAIIDPPLLSVVCSATDETAPNASNGTISITPTGGIGAYTYSWTGPNGFTASSQNISGLTAGTYTVTVTDVLGCSETISCTVDAGTCPTINIAFAGTPVSCFGGNDGTVSATPTGGAGPYTYAWSNGQTTETATGLTAGTYSVIITDANGCTGSDNITITQPTAISLTCSATQMSAAGANDGSISSSATGGTPNYTYSWTGPNGFSSTNQNITGLAAGTYTLTLTDANGCTASTSCVINSIACPTISLNPTIVNISCFGGSDGSISLSPTGGAAPYTYSWNTGSPNSSITNLLANTYTVTVTDANGCMEMGTYVITEPSILTANCGTVIHESAPNANDGSIFPIVSGGTSPYNFNWSGPNGFSATTTNIVNLAPATYSATITDANGCTTNILCTINSQGCPNITVNLSSTPVSCFGGSDGVVQLTSTNAVTPRTYLWNTGATTSALFNVSAGTYSLTVTDGNGCTGTASITVSEPPSLLLTCTSTNTSSPTSNDGSIDLTVNGGTPPYTYAWNTGATTQDISGLSTGNYTVMVTDANGCMATLDCPVNSTACPTISLNPTVINPVCSGDANGSISLNPTGGAGPYSYSWNTGSPNSSITNLLANTYTVTVTDANGCTQTGNYTLIEPPILTVSCTATAESAPNANDGSISLSTSGGTAPYSYSWTGSNGYTSTNQNISNLAPATYTVVVTDANGCTNTVSCTVNSQGCPSITVSGTRTNVSCFGAADGSINVSASGGVAPYSYAWTGPSSYTSTSQNITGLTPGMYSVTATDANGCSGSNTFTITQPSPLSVSCGTVIDESAPNANNGSISPSVSGGTTPYAYSWSGPSGYTSTSQNISSLAAGTYTLIVTDANGCSTSVNCTIAAGSCGTITLAGGQVDVSCFGGSDGSASVTSVTGAVMPFSWSWSNGATGSSIAGVPAGIYSVTLTDANGCTGSTTFTILQPSSLMLSCTATNESTAGANDGSINLGVSGGTFPYTYAWTGPNGFTANSQDISNLAPGTYTVTVTDANGCSKVLSCAVSAGGCPTINTTISTTDISCFGANNGAATPSISGGTTPYTYAWSGPNGYSSSSQNITGLAAGTYSLTVTDANGCTGSGTITISEPPALMSSCTVTHESAPNANDGSITLNTTGGTTPYSYSWTGSNGYSSSSQNIFNLAPATYTVDITDANGCMLSLDCVVNSVACPTITIGIDFDNVSCFGGSDGSATALPSGGLAPYTYVWNTGATTATINNLTAGTYSVMVTDFNGCMSSSAFFISQPSELRAIIQNINCDATGSSGDVFLAVQGGTAPYTYEWVHVNTNSVQSTSEDLINAPCGDYELQVTDANGCTVLESVTIPACCVVNVSRACDGAPIGNANILINNTIVGQTDTNGQYTITQCLSSTDSVSISGQGDLYNGIDGQDAVAIREHVLGINTLTQTWQLIAADTNGNGGITIFDELILINPNLDPHTDWVFIPTWHNLTSPTGYPTTSTKAQGLNFTAIKIGDTNCNATTQLCPCTGTISVSTSSTPDNGTNNGSVTATPTGGTAPYTYVWRDGNGQTSTVNAGTINNLPSGEYFVIVNDACGCTTDVQTIIVESTVPPTNNLCNLNLNSDGGDAGYLDTFTATGNDTLVVGFDPKTLSDRLIISVNGTAVVDSGCYSSTGCGSTPSGGGPFISSFSVSTGDTVTVQVIPNCDPSCSTQGTYWELLIACQ